MTGLSLAGLPGPDGSPILVAVSGGRDSVGLLERLLENAASLSTLVVGHVDHGMRPDSAADASWVASHAGSRGLECLSRKLETVPAGETEARAARYEALADMAHEAGSDVIVTAHHAGDQLETRLFNLIRGCSPEGFAGMKPVRVLLSGLRLVRPALGCPASWLHDAASLWREDPTNAGLHTPRNILRHEIIPRLQTLHPRDAGEALETFSRLLADDGVVVDALVPRVSSLSYDEFDRLPRALQRRWLRRFAELDSAQVDRGVEAALSRRQTDLGGGVRLVPRDGRIEIG